MSSEITKQTDAQDVLPPEPDKRALNALGHGMTAQHVRPDEREGYAQHAQQVRASTGASTYLEQRLADRAALALWRLDRVAAYEAAVSSRAQHEVYEAITSGKTQGPAGAVTAAYEVLADLTGHEPQALQTRPELSERAACSREGYAQRLDLWAIGEPGAALSEHEAAYLGARLGMELLEDQSVTGGMLVKAMMGRPARKGEGDSVENYEWMYEPGEIPGLLTFARERWGGSALPRLAALATVERMKAAQIRTAQRYALSAVQDALAVAALPRVEVQEKITRYEAHLERVLYRALHDLEAARLGREGKATPGPLRGVLDEKNE